MRLIHSPLVIAVTLLGLAPVTPATEATTACERALAAAEKTATQAGRGAETVDLFTTAFRVCEKTNLSAEMQARVAAKRAEVLHLYRNDPTAAIAIYERGLADLIATRGVDSPARIDLLEGLASALESRSANEESAASDRSRSSELRDEALTLRRAVYGERSPEAVRGLLLLGFTYLPEQPGIAEEYVTEAVEITSGTPFPTASQAEALSSLAEIYRLQGRDEEALAASERAGEIFAQVYPDGEGN